MSITVITPVWNNADTIADCIQSINRQTLKCQHIIVDGGSTDGTLDVIEQHRAEDAILISESDQGMYDAINKGLKLATGEIVGVLNSDDFYATDTALTKVAQAFQNATVDACYGDLHYVDKVDTGKVVRNWKSGDYKRENFFMGWMPPHPTFFLRRRLYEKYGEYRLDMGTAADYELMLRMLFKHKVNAAYIPQVMVHMRNDGMSNASLKNRIRANRNDRLAWRVNEITPRPWTLIAKPLGKLGQWFSGAR
ncbi:glycosyltransferase [Pseudohalioglobus sediminis]|uniref:Glycosyltransferase n=1 Tax=Pseudohalioglobus sediminis TaxID=2606449 RepID=A0A5B0WPC5_9GAMM|nr:glycosyltransferase family 2 protein [Pseudohalioglobus sediminis]KAA1188934.1 glycosyltransferase [Pseudohalioglobus sediminis]